jgi:hypothetical protein
MWSLGDGASVLTGWLVRKNEEVKGEEGGRGRENTFSNIFVQRVEDSQPSFSPII